MTGHPSTGVRSLIGIGTPANGGRSSAPVGDVVAELLRFGAGVVVVAPDDRVDGRVEAVDRRSRAASTSSRGLTFFAANCGSSVECGRELIWGFGHGRAGYARLQLTSRLRHSSSGTLGAGSRRERPSRSWRRRRSGRRRGPRAGIGKRRQRWARSALPIPRAG